MQLLYRINRTGTTVLVATHDHSMVDRMRRRVIELEPGRIVRDELAGRYAPARHRHRRVRRAAARAGAGAAPRGRRARRRLRRRFPRLMKLGFFLREALRSISRNAVPSFAALASVLVTLLVLGVFIPIVQATTGAANDVRDRVLVNVYLKKNATQADVERVRSLIENDRRRQARGVRPPSRAYAAGATQEPGGVRAARLQPAAGHVPRHAEGPGQRPEPRLRARAAHAGRRPTTADPSIDAVKSSKDETKKILVATRVVKLTTGLLAILLVIASVLLISNTVRLSVFSRRREVQVMKLVGATDGFIRWPFVLEGIILGALGALLAVLLLAVMKVALVDPLVDDFSLLAAPDTIGFGFLVAVLLITGVARERARLRDLTAPLPAGLIVRWARAQAA